MKTFSLFIFSFFTSFISLSHLALAMDEKNKEDGKTVFVSQGSYNMDMDMESKEEKILSSPLDLLPLEVAQHIFSFSPTTDLKNLSLASHQAKEFASIALSHRTITLQSPKKLQSVGDDNNLPFINPFFASASSVKLHTKDPSLNPLIEAVVGFPRLTALEFYAYGNKKRYLRDEDLNLLQKCPKLTSLNFESCKQITGEGLKSLPESLTSLTLERCWKITDEGLKSLPENLISLNLKRCEQIADEGLKSLVPLINLTSLNLQSCHKITDEGLKNLKELINLTSLNLSGCWEIADKGLKSLPEKLTSLNLSGCHEITNKGLKSIAPLINLTSLNLQSCHKITDEGLQSLAPLIKLTSLNLRGCWNITDEGLKSLAPLINLTSLNLQSCHKITDEGLESLKELANLTFLDLRVTKVSQEGVERLREKLPACQILYGTPF